MNTTGRIPTGNARLDCASGAIKAIGEQVIAANPKAVADFKGGKTNVIGWLTGQVMKESKGKANPKIAARLVNEKLAAL